MGETDERFKAIHPLSRKRAPTDHTKRSGQGKKKQTVTFESGDRWKKERRTVPEPTSKHVDEALRRGNCRRGRTKVQVDRPARKLPNRGGIISKKKT